MSSGSGYWQKELETAPGHELRALQSLRLSKTVRRVYDRVELYRKRMDELGVKPEDIRTIEDLRKLPFTYKQDLRDTYPYGMFAVDMEEVARIHASSGTTGKQIVVGYTKKDLDMWAECCARALTAIGGTPKDFVHVSYGYGLFTGGLGMHYGAEAMGATAIPSSVGNTARQITVLRDFGSTIICCTPSYALFLAEAMTEQGISKEDISLKAGFFGAEPWSEEMRKEIEDKLGLKAYDIYGLSEIVGPGVSFECTEQAGMHINEDHFYPEIIDPDTGEVLPDGSYGELVFTCLSKEAFPLIRYRTRDVACLERGLCGCGRTLVRMKKPRGRTDDMLIIRGVNVFPSQVESVLLSLGNTAPHYMLVVDRVNNTDTLEIQVEIPAHLEWDQVRNLEQEERRIQQGVESVLGISAKVRLVETKSIPRSEGKSVHVQDRRRK